MAGREGKGIVERRKGGEEGWDREGRRCKGKDSVGKSGRETRDGREKRGKEGKKGTRDRRKKGGRKEQREKT